MSRGNFAPGKNPLAVRNMFAATINAREVQGGIAL